MEEGWSKGTEKKDGSRRRKRKTDMPDYKNRTSKQGTEKLSPAARAEPDEN